LLFINAECIRKKRTDKNINTIISYFIKIAENYYNNVFNGQVIKFKFI